MSASRLVGAAALATVVASLAACGGDDAGTPTSAPRPFFGVATQEPPGNVDFARMAAGGVGSYRLVLNWAAIEPQPGTYAWLRYDEIAEQLAVHDIEPIATVFGTPSYLAEEPTVPPVEDSEAFARYVDFVRAAAARYGPGGTFWTGPFARSNPGVEPQPVRTWEIWNEPNTPTFWSPEPDVREYARMFKRSEAILRGADPGAEVAVAGMFATPNAPGAIGSSEFLRTLYEGPGVVEAADAVGVHPYGPRLEDVRRQMVDTRRVMGEAGDGGSRMLVTEIGWGSDPEVQSELATTRERQAELLRETYLLMAENRERWDVGAVLWFSWRDPSAPVSGCGWCASAGLLERDLDSKPAWVEFTELTGGEP